MADLSPEDRARIYEEERLRRESDKPWPKPTLDVCAVVSCVCSLIGLVMFPIFWGPIALAFAAASGVRMTNAPHLTGQGYKVTGFVLGLLETCMGAYYINQAAQALQGLGGG